MFCGANHTDGVESARRRPSRPPCERHIAIAAGLPPAKIVAALDDLAKGRGASRAVIALAWLLRHPSGIVPIVGSSNPEHIREAAKAIDVELTRDEWYRLLDAACGQRLP